MANPQNKRLTGLNPLAYMGVEPITPPLMVIDDRAPTVNDYENFNLGSFWLDSDNQLLYILADKAAGVATWLVLDSNAGDDVTGLVADDLNTALPVAGLVNVLGGANIHTTAGGNTLSVILNDAIDLPSTNAAFTAGAILINSHRFMHAYGSQNTFLGQDTGNGTLTGNSNTGIGYQALNGSTTGFSNTAVGYNALTTLTTASNMVAIGTNALANLSTAGASAGSTAVGGQCLVLFTGTNTTAVGRGAGTSWLTGAQNVLMGDSCASVLASGTNNTFLGGAVLGGAAGTATGPITDSILIGQAVAANYTTTESSNIIVGNAGTVGDNHVIRVGTYASSPGAAQQNKCYIAAAYSNFGTQNTFVGEQAGNITLTTGSSVDNVAVGYQAADALTTAAQATAVGSQALSALTTGGANTGLGYNALLKATTGTGNTAVGSETLTEITTTGLNTAVGKTALFIATGERNTAVGNSAGVTLTTGDRNVFMGESNSLNLVLGSNNVVIGQAAYSNATGGVGGSSGNIIIGKGSGGAYLTDESNNLLINSSGVATQNNVIEIGFGTGGGTAQTKCFINAIRGVTTDVNDAVAVLVDSAGQLGTVSSSRRGKENIHDMGAKSAPIMQFRPVTFSYISDRSHSRRYGLIAEEVEEIMPEMVTLTEEGLAETVKYHDLPVLMLNELQRLEKRVTELEAQLHKKKCC